MDLDLLISGGTVVDGTGSPAFEASVGVLDGRIVVLRSEAVPLRARRVISAVGKVVSPGFVDVHSHSALFLLDDGANEPKVRQGVTTELLGVDGNSYAPFLDQADLVAFARLNAGLEGRPDLDYDWTTVDSYLERYRAGTTVNVATLVGNSALRIGSIGWGDLPASKRDLSRMRGVLAECMQDGAIGLSTGLDYPPGSYASTDELADLARVAASFGGIYHTHVRYQLGDRFLDPIREALEISELGGCPVHVTHLYHRLTAQGSPSEPLDLIDQAAARGIDVTFDAYPYPFSSTRLLILIPDDLQAGGPDELLRRLSDPRHRSTVRAAIDGRARAYGGDQVWTTIHLNGFRRAENADCEGKTIAEIVDQRKMHPADVLCDLLVSEDLGVNEVAASGDDSTIPMYLGHRLAMVGTDSVFIGARPSPRTYGSYPRVLGELVRDLNTMTLEMAVSKMTSFPAQRLGLSDRGVIRDGMAADITIFDPFRVRANATYEHPRQYPDGIAHVIINGELVLDDGHLTSARPGKPLRRGRDS